MCQDRIISMKAGIVVVSLVFKAVNISALLKIAYLDLQQITFIIRYFTSTGWFSSNSIHLLPLILIRVCRRISQLQKETLKTHITAVGNLESPINQTALTACRWMQKEARVPGENPSTDVLHLKIISQNLLQPGNMWRTFTTQEKSDSKSKR